MTVRNDIIESFRGFSMAMYSTWLWHRPSRSMFDAGEGISPSMRNHVFAIENVFLTHGHHDHVGGLAGLALARGAARGDKEKPFSVYHPGGWDKIEALKRYVRAAGGDMGYELNWIEVAHGSTVSVSDDSKTFVRAFQVDHSRGRLCLGYAMVERRVRLREEFSGLTGKEIVAIVKQDGKDAISEPYEKIVFAYTGDCTPVDPDSVRGAEVLFHEGTFVGDGDMDPNGGHSTVRGAVESAAKAGVGALVVCHVSTRYTASEAGLEARKAAAELGFPGAIKVLDGARMVDVGGAM